MVQNSPTQFLELSNFRLFIFIIQIIVFMNIFIPSWLRLSIRRKSVAIRWTQLGKMMRRPQNYGYEPVPQNQSDDLEIENEKLAEDLKNKISSLKSLTIDIGKQQISPSSRWSKSMNLLSGDEVRYQDKILKDLDDDMSRTGGFMHNTIGRVMRLSKHRKGYICYMFLFALLVFFILYVVVKFR